jgi:uncharacterized membrane protein
MRLLILCQVFTLFFLIFLPILTHMLSERGGKVLYALLAIVAIGLALALRQALDALE